MGPQPESRVVWKFTAPVAEEVTIEVPHGAELLHIADQYHSGQELDFWFMLDPDGVEPAEARRFRVLGTGQHVRAPRLPGRYLASVVTAGGLVWHVFEAAA